MKSSSPKVVVVGSLVLDLVFRVARRPRPGETLAGEEFGMFLGGKGFNQALACHRLGVPTVLVGRCGRDEFGDRFIERLTAEGMCLDHVTRDPAAGTGVAAPLVFPDGRNAIVGVPRANRALAVADVEAAEDEIATADVLMLQFEVNPAASRRAAELARRHGTTIVLDPAPAGGPGGDIAWPHDYLVPNEVEADMLTDGDRPEEWARELNTPELRAVVISRGARGAVVSDRDGQREHPGYRVAAVDTTGAGDAFRAGLAVMLAADRDIDAAVRFANACGALACTVAGAEPSLPRRREVEEFMQTHLPAGGVPEVTDDID
jgi:ribokinase